jgi:outer membrane protein OmpA-like peptidoglycan-associated protein
MGFPKLVLIVGLAACGATAQRPLKLDRVILYQNGIGYFERSGVVGGDRLILRFSHHELDDVMKTLTVIDRSGSSVATVDIPTVGEKDHIVPIGVKLSGGRAHDVQVSYAVPTPTWKAAYRVVLDDNSSLLQAWAVIDNASQEDWVGVKLTLATGAPISYALDLHTPQFVDRPDASGNMVAPAVRGPIANEKVNAAQGDKDGDAVANADDLCPDAAEDKDGFEDDDGCPDPDNDKDRIADTNDKCPNEPETYNGADDDDGCPDRGRVVITDTAIEIFDMIYFKAGSDTVQPQSFPIADAVAATLQGNPSITLVEIQGHAAANEPDAFGIAARRAAAVRAYIIKKGVDGRRLQVQSYGNTQPIDPRTTETARAKNRRAAFLILKRSDGDDSPRVVDRPMKVDTKTVQASIKTNTKPVEVAGAVRYELSEPITVRRGTSTMVSILNKQISAEDAFLWRPDDNAPGSDVHPFRAVRLVNGSGFTLQPGPIAIFARGTFVGDSLLDRLDLDETAWVPYALDSGTSVTPRTAFDEKPVRIVSLLRGTLVVENASIRTTRYTIAVGRQPPKQIYIRHRKAAGYQLGRDLPPGTLDQGTSVLMPIPISAAKTSEFAVEEREPRRRSIQLLDARAADLTAYLDGSPNLPAGLPDKLRAAIALRKEMTVLEDEVSIARSRFTDVVQRAHEIRDSLKALDRVANADDLRKKLVANLRETTAESDTLTKTIEAKMQTLATARTRLQDLLRDLALEEPKR